METDEQKAPPAAGRQSVWKRWRTTRRVLAAAVVVTAFLWDGPVGLIAAFALTGFAALLAMVVLP